MSSPSVEPEEAKEASSAGEAPPFVISPTLFLLVASMPFALGAYSGYRREVKRAAAGGDSYNPGSPGTEGGKGIVSRLMEGQQPPTNSSSGITPTTVESAASKAGTALNPAGPVMAARALVIGSMLSIGGVGLFAAAILYASGYESVDDAVRSLREWGPRKRREMEKFVGLPEGGESAFHPDVIATKHMSEEEELEYVKRKYLSELYEDGDNTGDEDRQENNSNKVPPR